MTLLGVNIDHVATLRQARGEAFPDPVQAAFVAIKAGADGITAHLREDRRHIQDADMKRLKQEIPAPLNMEMAATREIIGFAEKLQPAWACLVPEKRREVTTEGGLDVVSTRVDLKEAVTRLHGADVKVSLFIEPDLTSVEIAKELQADAVELHTGAYARAWKEKRADVPKALDRIRKSATRAAELGLIVNAGHGIDYDNAGTLLDTHAFHEFNIGFAIVARAVFVGFEQAVHEMKEKMKALCAAS